MAWVFLVVAICLEVSGTVSMKLSRGFEVLGPTIAVFVFYAASIAFLTLAIRDIEISVAYAVWSALGTGLVACIGIAWFHEGASLAKIASLALIVLGVVGLHRSSELPASPPAPRVHQSP